MSRGILCTAGNTCRAFPGGHEKRRNFNPCGWYRKNKHISIKSLWVVQENQRNFNNNKALLDLLRVSWLLVGVLGRFVGVRGRSGLDCPLLRLALHNIMLSFMRSTRFCIYLHFSFEPFGAAVCAQHMESTLNQSRIDSQSTPN